MKKSYLFFAFVFVVAFSSCKEEKIINAPIEKIDFGWLVEDDAIREKYNVGEDGIFIGVNNTRPTSVLMEPISAKWPQVTYSTADSTIAVIGVDGLLTGVGKGVTEVYAVVNSNDKELRAALKVYVDTISVEKIDVEVAAKSFDEYSVIGILRDHTGLADSIDDKGKPVKGSIVNSDTLFLNDKAVMTISTEPMEASFSEIEWTSSDENVLKVNGDTIIAVGNGSARVSGRLKQNHNEALTLEYDWVVAKAELSFITWATSTQRMYANTSQDVMPLVVFIPSYASDKEVTFTSTNPDIFGVANGKIYCYANSGESYITVSCKNYVGEGYSAECRFRVK